MDGVSLAIITFLLTNRGLPLGASGRLYSSLVLVVMLYGSETWPFEGKDVIRLKGNDATIVRWKCNVKPVDRFFFVT